VVVGVRIDTNGGMDTVRLAWRFPGLSGFPVVLGNAIATPYKISRTKVVQIGDGRLDNAGLRLKQGCLSSGTSHMFYD